MKTIFKDLKNRFFASILLILFSTFIIYFSDYTFMKFFTLIAVSVLGALAAQEFVHFARNIKVQITTNLFITAVISEVIAFFFYSHYVELNILPMFIALAFFIFVFLKNFQKIQGSFIKISVTVFGFFYTSIPLAMLLPILYIKNFDYQDGRYWIFYLIAVTKLTDVGAYFGGKFFGKKKLAEHISPKKTIAGSVFGMVFALVTSVVFYFFMKNPFFKLDLVSSIVLGVVLGMGAQIGDLCESLLKRDIKVKDSGKIPGLGGILDFLDSLTFNVPILYCFLIK